jgi:UDP-N-acetylglucosamine:LPS N-acetylglucosamine transferase
LCVALLLPTGRLALASALKLSAPRPAADFFSVPAKKHEAPFSSSSSAAAAARWESTRRWWTRSTSWASGVPLCFTHQTGERDFTAVRTAYARRGINADVLPFINDMPARFAAADLIICRSGASTVAELAAAARAAILVPFPHATDQHQLRNAEVLARAGAARLLEQSILTGERLAGEILALLAEPAHLTEMENAVRSLAVPDAAARIADLIESVA